MEHGRDEATRGGLAGLTLMAIGVVFGDIGTSPLYAMRQAFGPAGGLVLSDTAVLGVLSLIFWALLLVVSLKYVTLIMRADNKGEGGILALFTLAKRGLGARGHERYLPMLAMAGAALFYGDGVITPAISVLSAVEGLHVVTPLFEPVVLPLAVAILIGLFLVQRVGTGKVGRWFGLVIAVWFAVLGILGAVSIIQTPGVLRALSPTHAFDFFLVYQWQSFAALGAVVLAITGAEALYADMGHVGRRPIRVGWFALVLPSLVLNYFGQGALLMRDPAALQNPFYLLAPGWATMPMVVLATCASVIASQAMISGAFSLTRQAIQLGYLPRMDIRHTSESAVGQVYVPRINWLLMVAVIALVVGFGSSGAMAAAYGIAVTGAMTINGVLAFLVARTLWGWNRLAAAALFAGLLVVDLAFLSANALKIPAGGWFPILLAAAVYVLISTWRKGRAALFRKLHTDAIPLSVFVGMLPLQHSIIRIRGTAIFLSGRRGATPRALLHNLKHNQVLHEKVVVVTVLTQDVPRVAEKDRYQTKDWGQGVYSLVMHCGFMETPDVPEALRRSNMLPADGNELGVSYFMSRETLIRSSEPDLPAWRERIFILLSHEAQSVTDYFCLPPDRVVELGAQVRI